MNRKKRIALFGGSFDPPHLGHFAMAAAAYEQARLDEVIWLPCAISPHKLATPPSDPERRMNWVRLAVRNAPWARVSSWEIEQNRAVFSYETAEHFVQSDPDSEWFYLLGGDQWNALLSWREPSRLAACVTFLVMARNGEVVEPRENFRMQVVRGEHLAASREIREKAKRHDFENLPMDSCVLDVWRNDFFEQNQG